MTSAGQKVEQKFETWCACVEFLLKSKYCINLNDIGWTPDELGKPWRDGETPDGFVAWFARKYDLETVDGVFARSYEREIEKSRLD